MRLDLTDIRALLERDFSGNILYQPVHLTQSAHARPLAQLIPTAQLLQSMITQDVAAHEPRTLDRDHSALTLRALLHHEPKPLQRKR